MYIMVSTVLIYWDFSRKCQDVCPSDAPMDIWTTTFAFVPACRSKQGHHDPKQAISGGRSWQFSPPRGGRMERGGTGWESWSLLKPFPHTQVSFCWEFLGDEQVTSHTCDGHPEGELKPFIGRYRDRWCSGFLGQGGWVLSPWKNVGLVSWKPESSAQPPLEGSRVFKLTS